MIKIICYMASFITYYARTTDCTVFGVTSWWHSMLMNIQRKNRPIRTPKVLVIFLHQPRFHWLTTPNVVHSNVYT